MNKGTRLHRLIRTAVIALAVALLNQNALANEQSNPLQFECPERPEKPLFQAIKSKADKNVINSNRSAFAEFMITNKAYVFCIEMSAATTGLGSDNSRESEIFEAFSDALLVELEYEDIMAITLTPDPKEKTKKRRRNKDVWADRECRRFNRNCN